MRYNLNETNMLQVADDVFGVVGAEREIILRSN